MPDARIASAMRKIISFFSLSERESVFEEQRSRKYTRFLRGRHIAYMIYGHFQPTGACETAQGLSDLFSICLQEMDVQDFNSRWAPILLGTSEMPPEYVLEGLCRNGLHGSELQTVFAMYNQEWSRDRVARSYQKYRKMVTQHVDQTIWTRNFKAQNQRIETGVFVKSQNGRNVSTESKVEECFQWKANGQCSRGDSCSFHPSWCA